MGKYTMLFTTFGLLDSQLSLPKKAHHCYSNNEPADQRHEYKNHNYVGLQTCRIYYHAHSIFTLHD